jgi:translation initiation factor IF-2
VSNKVRVYELAKETGLHNKEVLRRLAELDIDAKSHSSSVSDGDALRFRDSLGKTEEQRKADEQAKRDKENAELERYRSMQAAAPPERKKAAKVLPPHLRQQQEQEAAAGVAGDDAAPAPTPAESTPSAPAASCAAGRWRCCTRVDRWGRDAPAGQAHARCPATAAQAR